MMRLMYYLDETRVRFVLCAVGFAFVTQSPTVLVLTC